VTVFVAAGLANFALDVNPLKMPRFPGALTCFAHALKVAFALFLAMSMKESGKDYWASILGDFALGLAIGQAFNLYQPLETKSKIANWHQGKLNKFGDGFFAACAAAVATWILSSVFWNENVNLVITFLLATGLLMGKVGFAMLELREYGVTVYLHGMKSLAWRLALSLVGLTCLGALFANILPQFSYDLSIGEKVLAFFIGALLAFL
ncbi:hypothetical protein, partial [Ensifer sp. M14]|uniref:hypothetical protein n=1 Tax=Ensifer sp. M14 TaxID=2203782 RepID=UPI001A7E0EBD